MSSQKDLYKLVKGMTPTLNQGEYVFVSTENIGTIDLRDVVCTFKEAEGLTLIINREVADKMKLKYAFVASWITLEVNSSLEAVGLTAVFSTELAKNNISCNVIAAFHHDHIFVAVKDSIRAVDILENLAKSY